MTSRPLRIAMIGSRGIPANYGGVERAVEELSAHLAARGHDVTVYGRGRGTGHHRGVRTQGLGHAPGRRLATATNSVAAVIHALALAPVDVVHLHATGPGALAVLTRHTDVATVTTFQGMDWRRERWGPATSLALRAAAGLAATAPDRTIVVSRVLTEVLRARHAGLDPVYIPNGVAIDDGPGEHPGCGLEAGRFVLFLGRLVPEKGVDALLDAYKRVQTDLPLVVAGGGDGDHRYVAQLRRQASADDRIRLLGPVVGRRKRWLLQHARVFVQPSTVEGLPITLLEAMASGRYPVVSDILEHLEVIGGGGTGRPLGEVFRAGDARDLATKLGSVLRRTDLESAGEGGASFVCRRYDWFRIASETESVYRAAIASRQQQQ